MNTPETASQVPTLLTHLKTAAEIAAVGLASGGLYQLGKNALRGATGPVGLVALPVLAGTLSGLRSWYGDRQRLKNLGAYAYNSWAEKYTGSALGIVLNPLETIAVKSALAIEKTAKKLLDKDTDQSPKEIYVQLKARAILTRDFKHYTPELKRQIETKLDELGLEADDVDDWEDDAHALAEQLYYKCSKRAALATGLKMAAISFIGIELSEKFIQETVSKIDNSEFVHSQLQKLASAREHLEQMLANNTRLASLKNILDGLKHKLTEATAAIQDQAKSLLGKIGQVTQEIDEQKINLAQNHLAQTPIQEHIATLQQAKAAITQPITLTTTEWTQASLPTLKLPYGSGLLKALYAQTPEYIIEHGQWNTLSDVANQLADQQPQFYQQSYTIAKALVNSAGHGPEGAVRTIATFDHLGILTGDGQVNAPKIHEISELARNGDYGARKQLYDLLRWFKNYYPDNTPAQVSIPHQLVKTISVLEQQDAVQAQINTAQADLLDLQDQAETINRSMSQMESLKASLTAQYNSLAIPEELKAQLLDVQSQISQLEAANATSSNTVNSLLAEITDTRISASSSSSQIKTFLGLIDTLGEQITQAARDNATVVVSSNAAKVGLMAGIGAGAISAGSFAAARIEQTQAQQLATAPI